MKRKIEVGENKRNKLTEAEQQKLLWQSPHHSLYPEMSISIAKITLSSHYSSYTSTIFVSVCTGFFSSNVSEVFGSAAGGAGAGGASFTADGSSLGSSGSVGNIAKRLKDMRQNSAKINHNLTQFIELNLK
uniref:Uncharacterized protein n=1 Tax=Salix viminalis TaxID=40686 RepID=A0A6N2K970_SALVM